MAAGGEREDVHAAGGAGGGDLGSPGSGQTVLLRSWVGDAGLAGSTAWVSVDSDERDPQRFWLSALVALRQTVPGSGLARELTAAPSLDGWSVVERLLKDLALLQDRLGLLIGEVPRLVRGRPAPIRNLVTGAFRSKGHANIAAARRYSSRDDQRILTLDGYA